MGSAAQDRQPQKRRLSHTGAFETYITPKHTETADANHLRLMFAIDDWLANMLAIPETK